MEITDTLYREVRLHAAGMDTEQRTVPASLSSETPVERWFGQEVLVHSADAVDLARATDGLPLLFSHNSDQPIGVVRDVRLDGGKLRGVLHFSNNARASEIWADVQGGFLRNVSIGYKVNTLEEQANSDTVRITSWSLLEASVVAVPADATVGVNRSQEHPMTDETRTDPPKPALAVNNSTAVLKREQERREAIRTRVFVGRHAARHGDLLDAILDDPFCSVERARELLLERLGEESEPLGGVGYIQDERSGSLARGEVRITGGRDHTPEMTQAMSDAIALRAGIEVKNPHPAAVDFRGKSMREIADICLRSAGHSTRGMGRLELMGAAMGQTRGLIAHGTSDFSNVLANVANKALLQGFMEAASQHRQICRLGSLPDFKQASRPALSGFDDLSIVYENGEYKYGSYSDLAEHVQLATYGKMFSISRQAMINDDLGVFATIQRGMAASAARTEADLVFGVLTSNPTLNQDSTALFHSNHGNLVASGSGAAPSVSTVSAAKVAMRLQTDPSGNAYLNIRPALMIVPVALEDTANVLRTAEYDPSATAGTRQPNPHMGAFDVVSDPRLDADSTDTWYMAADPVAHDVIELAFLDGQSTPYLEQQQGFQTDGLEFKVRHDCAAVPLDFRGLYKNAGI